MTPRFKVLSVETVRADTYKVSVQVGQGKRAEQYRVVVYPAPAQWLILDNDGERRALVGDFFTAAQTARILASINN